MEPQGQTGTDASMAADSIPGRGDSRYRSAPAQVDLPALDHEVPRFWQAHDVFARSPEPTRGKPDWIFYEGPPTANGMPGTHHIDARVFKDLFPRAQTDDRTIYLLRLTYFVATALRWGAEILTPAGGVTRLTTMVRSSDKPL